MMQILFKCHAVISQQIIPLHKAGDCSKADGFYLLRPDILIVMQAP